MANRISYSLGCGRGESFDFSRSPANDVSGNGFSYRLGDCEFACLTGDIPIFDPGGSPEGIETDDVYGAVGPNLLWGNTPTSGFLQQCEFIVYCNGPVDEYSTMSGYDDRYSTRWVAKIQNGRVYYGKVGGVMQQVSESLIPDQDQLQTLGFCFDANARPCFSSQIGTNCYVWRYQAGEPQVYVFEGNGPKLFFTGELQPDNSLWDVACYYCFDGALSLAMQRDNFGTRYTVYNGASFSRVVHVGRGSGELSNRLYIACATEVSGFGVFKTPPYPFWPLTVIETTNAAVSFLPDGEMSLAVFATPPQEDSASVAVALSGDGLYFSAVLTENESDNSAVAVLFSADGSYSLAIVDGGSYSEGQTSTVAFNTDGTYSLVIVSGGSYSEGQTATVAFNADGDYSL